MAIYFWDNTLEGSVRKVGTSVRIAAQLIDATSDAHLWADKYNGSLEDVFEMQETLSRTIVEALKIRLNPDEDRRIAERPIKDVQAYECYLRAREEIHRLTAQSLDRALRLLENGLAITGDNLLLYASKGNVYIQYINSLIKPDEMYLEKAEACAKKLSELDPKSSYTHWLTGSICHKRGDVQQAVRHLKRAVAVDSHNPDALYWLSYAYRVSGKGSAARPLAQLLLALDPLTPYSHWASGWIDIAEGDFEAGLIAFRKMHELDPTGGFNRFAYAFTLALNGRHDDAYSLIDLLVKDAPRTFPGRLGALFKYALQGDEAGAKQATNEQFLADARWDEAASCWLADCYALIGHAEEAIKWLENAMRQGFINYPFLAEYDPFLVNIRSEDSFKRLMVTVKDRWEQFEV